MANEKESKPKGNRGGARQGAGRKTGEPNKRTAALVAKVESTGITPLDYLLSIMRDEMADQRDRQNAATQAAPYVHAKLSSVEMNASVKVSHESALDELE